MPIANCRYKCCMQVCLAILEVGRDRLVPVTSGNAVLEHIWKECSRWQQHCEIWFFYWSVLNLSLVHLMHWCGRNSLLLWVVWTFSFLVEEKINSSSRHKHFLSPMHRMHGATVMYDSCMHDPISNSRGSSGTRPFWHVVRPVTWPFATNEHQVPIEARGVCRWL